MTRARITPATAAVYDDDDDDEDLSKANQTSNRKQKNDKQQQKEDVYSRKIILMICISKSSITARLATFTDNRHCGYSNQQLPTMAGRFPDASNTQEIVVASGNAPPFGLGPNSRPLLDGPISDIIISKSLQNPSGARQHLHILRVNG